MQCRICFDEGDTTTLLVPCRCRGTSSYIHRTCLDQYIQYYPDRICRVCHGSFLRYDSPREFALCWVVVVFLTALLLLSSARLLVKIGLLGATLILSFYFLQRNLFSTTPLVFLWILATLFLPGGHSSAVYMWFIVLGAIAFVYTLSRQLPAVVVLGVLVTAMVAAYAGFLIVLAYISLDHSAFVVFLSLLYLAWYAWVHESPRLRFG